MSLFIIGAFFGWFVFTVFIVMVITLCGNRQSAIRKMHEDEKLSADVMKIGDLFTYGESVVESEQKAHEILNKIGTLDNDKKLEEKTMGCISRTTQIATCRHPDLPLLKSTMVTTKAPLKRIHMNMLKDYYRAPIYMSQAPLKDEFLDFVEVILQEKIGAVVWLAKPNEHLEAYIPMAKGGKLIIGEHQLEYELSGKREEYEFYFIRIIPKVKLSQTSMIRVIFVVAQCWTLTAEKGLMSKHCDVISLVQCFHDYTKSNKFPGLLVHHSAGVNWTAGFVACYIGRQVLLDKKKLNIPGICKYIKQHRHCAFTFESTSHNQIQVVHMVLGSFAQNFAYEDVGLMKTTTHENELFAKAKRGAPSGKSLTNVAKSDESHTRHSDIQAKDFKTAAEAIPATGDNAYDLLSAVKPVASNAKKQAKEIKTSTIDNK